MPATCHIFINFQINNQLGKKSNIQDLKPSMSILTLTKLILLMYGFALRYSLHSPDFSRSDPQTAQSIWNRKKFSSSSPPLPPMICSIVWTTEKHEGMHMLRCVAWVKWEEAPSLCLLYHHHHLLLLFFLFPSVPSLIFFFSEFPSSFLYLYWVFRITYPKQTTFLVYIL
jgi:hypothetical protein